MGNRVILGTRGNDHGLFVSKEGHNVLNCARKELIFDSTSHRSGLVYAGAKGLSLSTTPDNFLTTGSKGNLGYIPLVIFTEKNMGERGQYSPGTDSSNYIDNISQCCKDAIQNIKFSDKNILDFKNKNFYNLGSSAFFASKYLINYSETIK